MVLFRAAIIYLFLISNASAACIGSSPIWTTDGNEDDDVAECITVATAGDTINILAGDGTADWYTNIVNVPAEKPLNIIGPGVTNLTINIMDIDSSYGVISVGAFSGSVSSPGVRISGLKFVSPEDEKRTALNIKGKGWRVDNCIYESVLSESPGTGTALFVMANSQNVDVYPPTGLIDNCAITNGKVVVTGAGSFAKEGAIWASSLPHGTENTVYIEDCVFNFTANPDSYIGLAVDSNYSGSYVFRYNTLTHYDVLAHGLQAYNTRGSRAWEIYGNSFCSKGIASLDMASVKAGTGFIFYNLETSDAADALNYLIRIVHERSTYDIGAWGDCDGASIADGNETDEGGWLCRDQVGSGKDLSAWTDATQASPAQASEPSYLWNNEDESGAYPSANISAPTTTHVESDRDYYESANGIQVSSSSPFDGTSDTGWGTLLSRPSTCTTGVGYWATSQSGDLSASVGADPTAEISGTFYKCTATNTWTEYYTPYTYPHPLRGGNLGFGGSGSSVFGGAGTCTIGE